MLDIPCGISNIHSLILESHCEALNQTLCQVSCEKRNQNTVKGATDDKNCMICQCEKRKEEESNDHDNDDNSGEYFCIPLNFRFGMLSLLNFSRKDILFAQI